MVRTAIISFAEAKRSRKKIGLDGLPHESVVLCEPQMLRYVLVANGSSAFSAGGKPGVNSDPGSAVANVMIAFHIKLYHLIQLAVRSPSANEDWGWLTRLPVPEPSEQSVIGVTALNIQACAGAGRSASFVVCGLAGKYVFVDSL